MDATCKANGLDFSATKIKEIPETANGGGALNGHSSDAASNEDRARGVSEAMAAAATLTSSSSDYMLAAGQAINSTNQVSYCTGFDDEASLLIEFVFRNTKTTKGTTPSPAFGVDAVESAAVCLATTLAAAAARDPRLLPS